MSMTWDIVCTVCYE